MSWQAYAAVSGKRIGSGTAKLVLLELANHAKADGTAAWPSKATMAETAECDTKTVQRNLRKLEAAGWIRRGDQQLVAHLRADRRPVVYDIAMDDETRAQWAAQHGTARGDSAADTPADTSQDGGTECTPATPDDRTDCPPALDATGGHPGPNGGTPGCPPNVLELPTTPQPPASGGAGCARHTTTAPNCRGCGTTNRQLAEKARIDKAAAHRAAEQAAIAAERAKPRGPKPGTEAAKRAARQGIAAARETALTGAPR